MRIVPKDPAAAPPSRTGGRRHVDAALLLAVLASGVAAMADLELARFVAVAGSVSAAVALVRTRLTTGRDDARGGSTGPTSLPAMSEIEERALFLAMASHEIRTPLVGILGMADLLAATPLTPEQTAYVRAVRASGLSLIGLVDGYLQMTRQDAGRGTLTPAPTPLEAVVEDVVELLAPAAEAKGLELATSVASELPTRVLVDPVLLRQVLTNLAGNAVKYTDDGGVAIEVEKGERGILFHVRDTGIGIDPADAERIFREFERAEASDRDGREGTGLGLAIARDIVARMGGEITLRSRPKEGSVFSFDLALPAVETRGEERSPLSGFRIGFVSSGVVEPPLLARRLRTLGAECLAAHTPDMLAEAPPLDLLVVDHRTGHDASTVLARLHDLRRERPPAVCLVAPTRRSDLPRLRAAGFSGHLVKPVRAASLARVLAALVEAPFALDGSDEALAARTDTDPIPATAPQTAPIDAATRVLLVDDNEINTLLGRAVLEHLGHAVTTVGDGAAALEAVETANAAGRPFAVVLMDLHMPGLDGFSAIRALRAAEPTDGPRPLVVALTADGTPAAAARAAEAGADATMIKPIDRTRLADLLAATRPHASETLRSA